MSRPEVIFLDAVGTLFGVRGSVGEVYAKKAAEFGVVIDPEPIEACFGRCFPASPPLAFPDVDLSLIPEKEYKWWRSLTGAVFTELGYINCFKDFEAFFGELYADFATAAPWYVYDDVIPALNYWRSKGITLGIISNFDSRIYSVLEALELKDFFRTVTISSITGAAKPDPLIFRRALAEHSLEPSRAWHIGDSKTDDYEGARGAGIKAYLIRR